VDLVALVTNGDEEDCLITVVVGALLDVLAFETVEEVEFRRDDVDTREVVLLGVLLDAGFLVVEGETEEVERGMLDLEPVLFCSFLVEVFPVDVLAIEALDEELDGFKEELDGLDDVLTVLDVFC